MKICVVQLDIYPSYRTVPRDRLRRGHYRVRRTLYCATQLPGRGRGGDSGIWTC